MKIAVLSDAHGNAFFFQKCINEIHRHKVSDIFFLGDCYGYMRDGDHILTMLRKMDAQVLLGNHEAMLLGRLPYDLQKEEIYGLKKDRENISNSNQEFIKGLLPEKITEIEGIKILFVHGRPDDPLNGYLYENDKLYEWKQLEYDFVFMGHTHYPYIKKIGCTTYVNVGSCGLPRDEGTSPSYAIFDTQTREVLIHRHKIEKEELINIPLQNVHQQVYKCLMRERNSR